MSRGWDLTLFSGANEQDKGNGQNYKKNCFFFFYFRDDKTLEQAQAQRHCGVPFSGDIQNPPEHNPLQPALGKKPA